MIKLSCAVFVRLPTSESVLNLIQRTEEWYIV
jgi:hypothetical protein